MVTALKDQFVNARREQQCAYSNFLKNDINSFSHFDLSL